MQIKKAGGKIFGATLTANEQKALNMEVEKYLVEAGRRDAKKIDATILWVMHEQLGLGPKRLRRFFNDFRPTLDKLLEQYHMENSDQGWLCVHKLKEIGVDIEQWHKELYGEE